uniref:NR LBD domain-containing protein n=1 Tax=Parastrongyloides trichosuri TaxID=131310 RepID=A0A0N4ZAX0_PARTI
MAPNNSIYITSRAQRNKLMLRIAACFYYADLIRTQILISKTVNESQKKVYTWCIQKFPRLLVILNNEFSTNDLNKFNMTKSTFKKLDELMAENENDIINHFKKGNRNDNPLLDFINQRPIFELLIELKWETVKFITYHRENFHTWIIDTINEDMKDYPVQSTSQSHAATIKFI